MSSQLHFLWEDAGVVRRFRSGVSLHSHTMHSRESLAFLPAYAHRIPVVGYAVRRQEERYQRIWQRPLDYSRIWWLPPLIPKAAHEVERRQIEHELGLDAFVSLTDHDEIAACSNLRFLEGSQSVPVSLEWTVPFGTTFFHLGVHNLPAERAQDMLRALAGYTRDPRPSVLEELLAALHEMRETLVVLNHPLWDELGIGAEAHRRCLFAFLGRHEGYLHALELNGMRPWSENRRVVEMARARGSMLVSGGDRHGLEPGACINATNAGSFDEFVSEVRGDRMSDVLFLPHYRTSLAARRLEAVWDVLREYPGHAGFVRWTDRFFYCPHSGAPRSLSEMMPAGGPAVVRWFLAAMGLLENRQVRSAVRFALAEREEPAL